MCTVFKVNKSQIKQIIKSSSFSPVLSIRILLWVPDLSEQDRIERSCKNGWRTWLGLWWSIRAKNVSSASLNSSVVVGMSCSLLRVFSAAAQLASCYSRWLRVWWWRQTGDQMSLCVTSEWPVYRIHYNDECYMLFLITREAAWYIILVVSVCLSVCTLYVWQTITFENLDVGSSYSSIH